eukprot:6188278-Pleurochrysis_carterae.AAC.2
MLFGDPRRDVAVVEDALGQCRECSQIKLANDETRARKPFALAEGGHGGSCFGLCIAIELLRHYLTSKN